MAETIGTAYIQVEPNAQGIQSKISEAISGGSSDYGNALSGALGGAVKLAAGAIGAATAAVGAFAKSSVEAGKEFDSSMSQVAATMGVTTNEIGELRDFAREMGATTAFSAKDAADALNYMALAGYDAEKSMQMLPNVLNLAAAGDMDLARASDMVTDAQTALGLSTEETSLMVDQMAKASSKSNTSVEQLGDAFLKIGANARNLSGGTTELSTVLGVLADNGIKGSEAGTHLRNIMLSLTPSTDKAAAAWESLGVQAYDAQGNLRPLPEVFNDLSRAMDGMTSEEKTNMLSSMFNKTDLASINALLGTTSERYSELEQAISSAWYTTDSLTKVFDDHNNSLDEVKNRLAQLGIDEDNFSSSLDYCKGNAKDFAESLLEGANEGTNLSDVIDALGGNLNWVQGLFDETSGAAQAMADTQLDNLEGDITKFKSALGEAQIAISDQLSPALRDFVQFGTEGLGKITEGFKEGGLEGAMEAFKEILTEGIGMITGMIPDFISAGMELLGAIGQGILDNLPALVDATIQIGVKLVEGLTQAAPELARGAVTLIEALGRSLMDNSATIMQSGMDILKMLWDGITTGLPELASKAVEIMQHLGEGISQNLPQMIEAGLNALMEFSGSLRENAGLMIDAGLDLIMKLAEGLINSLPAMIETIPTIISNIAGIINDNAPKLITTGIELIGKLIAGIIQAIPTLIAEFPKIIKAIFDVITAVNWINLGSTIIKGIASGVQSLATNLPNALKSIGENAKNFLKNIDWKNLGSQIINFIVNGIKALVTAIPNALKAIGSQAMSAFKSIDWLSLGKNIIAGIVSGVTGSIGSLVDSVKNAAQSALNAAKSLLGISSPSKVFAQQVGTWIPAGIAEGIEDNMDTLDDAIEDMTNEALSDSLSGSLGAVSNRAAYDAPAGNTSNNTVSINVYAPEGMDVNSLAEAVQEKLNNAVRSKELVYA